MVVLPHALAANSVEVVPADVAVVPLVNVHAHDVLYIVALAVVGEGLVSVDQTVGVVVQIHTRPSAAVNVAQVAADVSVKDVPGVVGLVEGDVVVDHGSYATSVVPAGSGVGLSVVSILVKDGAVEEPVLVGVGDAAEDSAVVRTRYCFSYDGMSASTALA